MAVALHSLAQELMAAGGTGDDDKDDDDLDVMDDNIFELEGHTEQLQLDPSKFREPSSVVPGEAASERCAGRKGFEGEASNPALTSTTGRTEVSC